MSTLTPTDPAVMTDEERHALADRLEAEWHANPRPTPLTQMRYGRTTIIVSTTHNEEPIHG